MTKKNDFKNSYRYEIESVRVPKERIKMYREEESFIGPNDIALIKLETEIVFIPNKIMPVSLVKKFDRPTTTNDDIFRFV